MKTAFFPPRTLSNLPADNLEALAALCVEFEKLDGHARQMSEHHDDYVEALSILRGFSMVRDAKVPAFPDLGPMRNQNISAIATYFTKLRDNVRGELSNRHARGHFETKTEEYAALFARASVYEFSEPDFKRAQDLVNELRGIVINVIFAREGIKALPEVSQILLPNE